MGVLAYAVVDAVLNSVSVTFEPAGDGGSLAFRVVAERREPGGVVHRAFGRGDLAELSRGRCDPAAVLAGAVADAVDAVAGSVAAD